MPSALRLIETQEPAGIRQDRATGSILSAQAHRSRKWETYGIHDLSEPHFDRARVDMLMPSRVMDQFRQLSLPHLACSVSEDEEEGVDGVGLA
jgi:hypothetical protein